MEEEANKTHLASIGVNPTPAAMSTCQPYLREVVAQFGCETMALVRSTQEVFALLWPNDDHVPELISQLAKKLAESPDRPDPRAAGVNSTRRCSVCLVPDVVLEIGRAHV